MLKDDERELLLTLAAVRPNQKADGMTAEEVGVSCGVPVKRTMYILEKWTRKGWWECGVSLRTGWLTERGLAVAEELKRGKQLW